MNETHLDALVEFGGAVITGTFGLAVGASCGGSDYEGQLKAKEHSRTQTEHGGGLRCILV